MGHRLVVFYTEALPRHGDYRSIDPNISSLRDKTIRDLDWIRKRLEVISLRIDEEQLNLHIQEEENEQQTSTVQEPDNNTATDHQETQWESFSGWSADFSSNEDKTEEDSVEVKLVTRPALSESVDDAEDPADILDLDSEDETDAESDCDSLSDIDSDERAVRFEFPEEQHVDSSFLRVIASEEVEYEEDSEAVDSWAQDDQSLESVAEHAPIATRTIDYSDAEMLGNLLNRVTRESSLHIAPKGTTIVESTDARLEEEAENVDPSVSFSLVKDMTVLTLCSYPSFDEPPDDEKEGITSSPQDVMNFDSHSNCQHSPQKSDGMSFSDEEIIIPGLRI